MGGHYETKPMRIAVNQNCAHPVGDILKVDTNELQEIPWDSRYDGKIYGLFRIE